MPHEALLTYEEIRLIVKAAAELGISKIRVTGGEPLVRLGLPELIGMLAQIKGIDDISLTTNGVLLSRYAAELKSAGLRRVNVSLDTLKPEKFELITRGSRLDDVLQGIEAAKSAGLTPVKLNMVVMAGINDDEISDFAAKTIEEEWHVRFIECMPVASASVSTPKSISATNMRERIEKLGELEPCLPEVGNGPAKYFRFAEAKGTVGFITPISEHFCFKCNRLRLTSDGKLRPCLMSEDEIDLREPLRNGVSLEGLKQLIEKAVAKKPLRHLLAEGRIPKDRPFSQIGG
jgi:cyclic pyranopterin phosphate synthase